MKKLLTLLAIALTFQCVAQDTIMWSKTWIRDIGTDSVEFIESVYLKHGENITHERNFVYEKFVPAFKDDTTISIQNVKANKSQLQRRIELSKRDRIRNVDTNPFRVGTVVLDENGGMRNATFAEELLFLLQDYEKDCYNDSTEFKGSVYVLGSGYEYVGHRSNPWERIEGYIKDTVVMEHKQPTFKGFTEWIKNK